MEWKASQHYGWMEIKYLDLKKEFLILLSLKNIRLHHNNFLTLNPDVFINLPRPLTLCLSLIGDGRGREGNTLWNCASLCWLKHEEQHGAVTKMTIPEWCSPICVSADWNTLQCGEPGEQCLQFLYFPLHQMISSKWATGIKTPQKLQCKIDLLWLFIAWSVSTKRSVCRTWRCPILHQNQVQWTLQHWFWGDLQLPWWWQWNHHMSE